MKKIIVNESNHVKPAGNPIVKGMNEVCRVRRWDDKRPETRKGSQRAVRLQIWD